MSAGGNRDTDLIDVVILTPNGPRRATLDRTEYIVNDEGQITLPAGYYSSGYYERMTDSRWIDIPELTRGDGSRATSAASPASEATPDAPHIASSISHRAGSSARTFGRT